MDTATYARRLLQHHGKPLSLLALLGGPWIARDRRLVLLKRKCPVTYTGTSAT